MEVEELNDLLENLGIQPMSHVLKEVFEEVDEKGKGALDVSEFEQLMELLKDREGFTRTEYDEFIKTYHMFLRNGADEIESRELIGILSWLGYAVDVQTARSIVSQVDVDGSGSISDKEFVVCMRRIREHEVKLVNSYIKANSMRKDGTISAADAGGYTYKYIY